jgi:hypothetical protein
MLLIISILTISSCFSSGNSLAGDASVLCIYDFDGVISGIEINCENIITSDDAYAKKKRGYLFSNYPDCDSNGDHFIEVAEDDCVMQKKLAEFEKRNDENKLLSKELLNECDLNKDGMIKGREVKCKIQFGISEKEENIAAMEKDIAAMEMDTAATEKDIRETKIRIEQLKEQLGKEILKKLNKK